MSLLAAVILTLIYSTISSPQEPEINDQIEAQAQEADRSPKSEAQAQEADRSPKSEAQEDTTKKIVEEENVGKTNDVENVTSVVTSVTFKTNKPDNITQIELEPQESISCKIYKFITEPIVRMVHTPRVNYVLRNIGTCMVNGAMELISHYLPAPFMPLIASAAGLLIPFEPIVMLKQRMPVTSYRRAFQTALNGFVNTFDKYKVDNEFDPYMTRRFNRRFMNDDRKDNENDGL